MSCPCGCSDPATGCPHFYGDTLFGDMGFWDSVTGIIEKQFVNRAFNLSGQHKDIYCERCRRITDHVSISHAKSLRARTRRSARGVRVLSHLVGRLNDLNPAENILVGRPYRCGNCGGVILD